MGMGAKKHLITLEEGIKYIMKEIENINKLNYSFSSKTECFFYDKKCITPKSGRTYFWYDKKNDKLYYENFSRIKRLLHVIFGYKKQFNRKNFWSFFLSKGITQDPCPSRKCFKSQLIVLALRWNSKAEQALQAESHQNHTYQHRYDTRMADVLFSDDQIIESLEAEKLDPNALNNAICLSSALTHGRKKLFNYLLERSAFTKTDLNDALIAALKHQQDDLALILLTDKGADPNAIAMKGSNGEVLSALHLAIENLPKQQALSLKGLSVINEMLKHKPNVNTLFLSMSPLMLLCRQGHLDLVERLVEEHQANVNLCAVQSYQSTPFFEAFKARHFTLCEYFIDKGAKTGILEFKYVFNQWMMNKTEAIKKIMDLIVPKVDLTIKEIPGAETPLKTAAERRDKEAIQYLRKHGVDINEGEKWESLFSIAIKKKDLDFMQFLKDQGADPLKGYPLHEAVRNGYEEAIQFLLENGAHIDTQDVYGKTALHYAVEQDNEKLARILLAANARLDIQENSQYHDTAANLAKRKGYSKLAHILQQNEH